MILPYLVGDDMRLISLAVAAAAAAVLLANALSAQPLADDDGPAELPPADYAANQYVDSRGCVYIRAGYGGTVTWVPRVSRGRTVMCGFKPTFAAPAPAPAPKPQPEIAEIVPAPVPVAPPVPPAPVAAKPAPAVVPVAAPVKVAVAPAPKTVPAPRPAPVRASAPAPAPMAVTITPAPITIPKGYERAWKDDRLNPLRGVGTARGEAQMNLVWTQTVPRRLVADRKPAPVARAAAAPASTRQRLSARASTKTPAKVRPAAGYVQVGTFGQPANSAATTARLRQLGLPVAVAQSRMNGKPVQIVLAGPFAGQEHLNSALGAVRMAGYRDAFVRR
jgi:hypothetical protein